MKRLLILIIVLVFLVPFSVSGMPPPGDTCPEETIAVPMDLTELGGTELVFLLRDVGVDRGGDLLRQGFVDQRHVGIIVIPEKPLALPA